MRNIGNDENKILPFFFRNLEILLHRLYGFSEITQMAYSCCRILTGLLLLGYLIGSFVSFAFQSLDLSDQLSSLLIDADHLLEVKLRASFL
jgi:hypothetical protein